MEKKVRACAPPREHKPLKHRQKVVRTLPVGLEKVIYLAASDDAFHEALLKDREAAIKNQGFGLRKSELAMLKAIPTSQLETAIENMDISSENLQRRSFLRVVAATAATVVTGEAASGCGPGDTGVGPDWPEDTGPTVDTNTLPDHSQSRGISPDLPDAGVDAPVEVEDAHVGFESGGIRPNTG